MAGEKILVVDDAKNIRDTFSLAFDEYNIVPVASAREALGILRKPNDIDLVVLDVVMPEMDGLELLKEIKKLNSEHKVVIMTGYSTKDVAIEALRSQADEYIEKPFDIEKTKEIFKRLLDENRSPYGADTSDTEKKIKYAQRLIERNYHKVLSLQDISKEIFLSYKYSSRLFKQRIGKSFNEYKLQLKITSAKQLLRKTNYTISQVAYKVGYQNPDSFMKMFKRVTGLTPSEYRDSSKQRKKG
ncbi:MAG: response regulator [Candidatus Omnitrophica bacterium]|nr:response regulator [Candidatus Omnitrophota bacterium]